MKKLILTFCVCAVALGVYGQIDFSRYFDRDALPFLNTDDHLDVKFKWDMKGALQVQINDGLNNLEEKNLSLARSNFDEAIKIDSTLWLSYYYRGICNKKLKEYADAVKDFKTCIRLQPKQAEPYLELGEIYHENNRFSAARDMYEKAIDADPRLVHAQYNLGNVELATGDARRALRLYQKCNEIAPNFPDAYMAQGILKFKVRKNDNQSIEYFNKALSVDSAFSQAYFWRGLAYLSLNQSKKCLDDWTTVIRFNPTNTFMLNMRGFLHMEMDQYDYAFADIRKAFMGNQVDEDRFVGGQTMLDKRIDLQALANYLLRNGYGLKDESFTLIKKSFCLAVSGRDRNALKAASQAEKLEPSATVYYTRAIIYEHLKKHDSAFYDYGKALRLDKDIFDAHKKRSIYWISLKNFKMGHEHISNMFRLQPESIVAYRLRGLLRSHEEDYQGAIDDLAKFLKADSSDYEALRTSAVCKAALGDNHGANDDLRKVLYFDTRNWTMYEDVYTNYLSLGDTTKAIDIMKLYADQEPRIITPYLDLVRIYFRRNQWVDLRTELQRIKGLPPSYHTTQQLADQFFFEAMLHSRDGDYDEAIENFSRALKLVPAFQEAIYYRAKAFERKGDLKKALHDLKPLKIAGFKDAGLLYEAWSAQKNR